MRILIIILLITFSISCKQKSRNLDNETKAVDLKTNSTDSSRISYMIIGKSFIDGKFYIAYSKFENINTETEDLSYYFKGIYLNTIEGENLPAQINARFEKSELISNDLEYDLGNIGNYNDKVEIERINEISITNDSKYFHITVPENSDYFRHIFLKYEKNRFYKLFEFESSNHFLKIKVKKGYLISTDYSLTHSDTTLGEHSIEYNLTLNELKETKK